ncbi:MAG: hypothetical protein LKM39_11470 [Chiayiivirga sp.]|jgi:hypothetical protein|nr:hypothetical protein [Chiayiivirga sp.]
MIEPRYESADAWNRRYPPGTLVRVILRGGEPFTAETAGFAQQWGALAILTLRDRPGLWTASVLRPVSGAELS